MSDYKAILALATGAVSIAALHALIPSHWLAFAAVAKRQNWTIRRALSVTALAGAGHIGATIIMGLLLARLGGAVLKRIPPFVEHAATALLLLALGVYFLWSAWRDKGCPHSHGHHLPQNGEDEAETEEAGGAPRRFAQSSSIIGALVAGMTLSPCLDLLSVYVGAAAQPWAVLLLLSLLMALVTLSLMVALVWLTLRGLQRLDLHWLEHNEGFAIGGLLVALGLLLLFLK